MYMYHTTVTVVFDPRGPLNRNVKLAKWWEPVNEEHGILCNSQYIGCFKDDGQRTDGWLEKFTGNVPGNPIQAMEDCKLRAQANNRDGYSLQYNNQCFLLKEGATMFEFESQLNSTELHD